MPVLVLITALALLAGQDGGARPATPAETPSVSAAGSARPHTDFGGFWKYNDDESVNAATGRPESARAVNERRGVRRGNGPGAAPPGPPPPMRGGASAGGIAGAGGGANLPPDTLYSLYLQQRDTQRDLMEIAPRLRFDVTPATVTITDDLDRVLTFPTDAKKQKYQLGAAVFEAKTYWDNGQLKLDIEGPDGLKITETYFLSDDGSRLYLIIRIGEPVKDQPPQGVNRVYNRMN